MKTHLKNIIARIKYIIITLFFFILIPNINAQDVTLTTQTEIDNFNYTHVSKLTIREKTPGEITNLSGLSELQSVTDKLEIADNTSLTNLEGLNNLMEVYSQMYMGGGMYLYYR